MRNGKLLIIILLMLWSCSKHERINPWDPNGDNWLPWTGEIEDTSTDINDSITLTVTGHTPTAVESYHWTIDAVETVTTTGELQLVYAIAGDHDITMYTLNKNGIPSELSEATLTITASPPVLSTISDTIINGATNVALTATATDTNTTGSVTTLFWYPLSNPTAVTELSSLAITKAEHSYGDVVWGARDDDGLESLDTFYLRFNLPPVLGSLTAGSYWYDFDHGTGSGTIALKVLASDPDSTLDTLTHTATVIAPLTSSSLNDSILLISGIIPSQSFSYTVDVSDGNGGNDAGAGSSIAQSRPTQVKIFSKEKPFLMGDNSEWKSNYEQPIHTVAFSHDLWADTVEVTQKLFDSLCSTLPGYITPGWEAKYGLGDTHPAYSMSWEEAILFCNARSLVDGFDTVYTYDAITGTWGTDLTITNLSLQIEGNGYRLPTEAEWEFICRGGTSTIFFWGNDKSTSLANLYAWSSSNSQRVTHPVAELQTNAYGIYDICGNVSEWCWDYFAVDYYENSPLTDPTGPTTGTEHVVRGGARHSVVEYSFRSGARESASKSSRRIGFRTVRTAQE